MTMIHFAPAARPACTSPSNDAEIIVRGTGGAPTGVTLSAGDNHNHLPGRVHPASCAAASLEAGAADQGGRTMTTITVIRLHGVYRVTGTKHLALLDAERELLWAAECVSHSFRCYAGYQVPLGVNLRRLDAAVQVWQRLMREAKLDSDTNGYDRSGSP